MNKFVKSKLIGGILCIIIGIIFSIYIVIRLQSINDIQLTYMIGFIFGITIVGVLAIITSIRAIKNPINESKLENEIKDERLISINDKSMAIAFRISLLLEALISIICAFQSLMDIATIVGLAICVQLILYLVIYFIIKRKI